MLQAVGFLCFFTIIMCCGCGSDNNTQIHTSPAGSVAITHDDQDTVQELTIKTDQGTTVMKRGHVNPLEDLGVPLYPGITPGEGGTWSMTGTNHGENGAISSNFFTASDPIGKVADFYRTKLQGLHPEIFDMNMPTGRMVNISVNSDEADTINIILTEESDTNTTRIQIINSRD